MGNLKLYLFCALLWILIKAEATGPFQDLLRGEFQVTDSQPFLPQSRVLQFSSITYCRTGYLCYYQVLDSLNVTLGLNPSSSIAAYAYTGSDKKDLTITFDKNSSQTSGITAQILLYRSNTFEKEFNVSQIPPWSKFISNEDLPANRIVYLYVQNKSPNKTSITFSFKFQKVSNNSTTIVNSTKLTNSTGSSANVVTSSTVPSSSASQTNALYAYGPELDKPSDTSTLMIVGIVVGIVVAIACIVIITIGCYLRAKRIRKGVHHAIRNDPLSPENLDYRFPATNYENLKSSFPQSTCSICLEELKKEEGCRQLYCEHIFHSECVKLWLVNQLKKDYAFCPNCNRSVLQPTSSCRTQAL